PDQEFKIPPDPLRDAITERTRVFVLNSPGNPTGSTYTPEEIVGLAEAIEEAARDVTPDLVVVSDEIYEKIVYDGASHMSIGSIGSIAERVVTVNGLSKAYAMTGWRIGYAAGTGEFGLKVAKAMATLQGQMSTNITSFVYPAIRTALTQCGGDVETMRQAFASRAELVHGLITKIPGFVCPKPSGAFYLFPDVSAHFGKSTPGGKSINSAASFCDALLDEAKVAFVPGEDFGGCGKRCVRISFACSDEQIEQGMARLGEFVAALK
ncbi:MAG: aminotransferase class I/II-fold pyridoxal phosphate-dependent enzyme, partial [Phycisphaerales bacterium]